MSQRCLIDNKVTRARPPYDPQALYCEEHGGRPADAPVRVAASAADASVQYPDHPSLFITDDDVAAWDKADGNPTKVKGWAARQRLTHDPAVTQQKWDAWQARQAETAAAAPPVAPHPAAAPSRR